MSGSGDPGRRPVDLPRGPGSDEAAVPPEADTRRDGVAPSGGREAPGSSSGERSPILDVTVDVLFHTLILVSLYFLFAGHNRPGGGFIGGLVASVAFVLRGIAGPLEDPDGPGPDPASRPGPRSRLHPSPETLMGLGIVLATATAMGAWFTGHVFFDIGGLGFTLPVFGSVKVYSALIFDTGVYLVVVGLAVAELRVLGAEPEPERAAAGPAVSPDTPPAGQGGR